MSHFAAALGLTSAQAQLYRQVLPESGTSLAALAAGLLRTPEQLLAELSPLVDEGVVRVEGDTLHVADPGEALGLLLRRWSATLTEAGDRLTRVGLAVPELDSPREVARGATEAQPLDGEVLLGGDVPALLNRWLAETDGELLFLRPDQWRLPSESAMAVAVAAAVQQGRRTRAIYPARALREAPAVLVGRASIGEEIRVVPEVPTRLAIIGSRALLPDPPGLGHERRLVIRQPGLVAILASYFEALWDRSVAVSALGSGDASSDLHDLLLAQLARGAKDEQIARTLGVSLRTVRRRIAALMSELGVDSRFQAGVEAVRRGWL